jgi:hypothetical protein
MSAALQLKPTLAQCDIMDFEADLVKNSHARSRPAGRWFAKALARFLHSTASKLQHKCTHHRSTLHATALIPSALSAALCTQASFLQRWKHHSRKCKIWRAGTDALQVGQAVALLLQRLIQGCIEEVSVRGVRQDAGVHAPCSVPSLHEQLY